MSWTRPAIALGAIVGAITALYLLLVFVIWPDLKAARAADRVNLRSAPSVTPFGYVYTVEHDGHRWVITSGGHAMAHHPQCCPRP